MDLPINGMVIRIAEEADAEKLLEIYAPYVEKTAITFEYTVPSLEEFRERIRETLKKYPYLIAEKDGEVLGYAYTGAFGKRAAYSWAQLLRVAARNGGNAGSSAEKHRSFCGAGLRKDDTMEKIKQ